MNKKIFVIITIIVIASFALSACERPASKAPVPTATTEGEIPFPVATKPEIMVDILKGTQTAAALTLVPSGTEVPAGEATPAFSIDTPEPAAATPTVTMVAYPTPTPGRPANYTIKAGEFPYCIARRFNVDISELLTLNGLGLNSSTSIGQKLKIPQGGSFAGERALKAHPTTYTVKAGDTIGSIACSFGDADPNTIFAANGLESGAKLKVGQVIYIP